MQLNFVFNWSSNSRLIENFPKHCGNAGFPNRQDTGSALCVQMLLPGHMHTHTDQASSKLLHSNLIWIDNLVSAAAVL